MKVTITTPFARLTVEMEPIKAAELLSNALNKAAPKPAKHGAFADLFPMAPKDVAAYDAPDQPDEQPAAEPEPKKEAPKPAPAPTITPPVTPVAAPQSDDDFAPDMDDRVGFSAEEETPEKGYRGFLHVKCAKCHKEKSFHIKWPLKEYRCECGHTTPLKGLNKVVAKCDCGWDLKYYTNHDADAFDLKCPQCSEPALVKWSFRHKRYEKED